MVEVVKQGGTECNECGANLPPHADKPCQAHRRPPAFREFEKIEAEATRIREQKPKVAGDIQICQVRGCSNPATHIQASFGVSTVGYAYCGPHYMSREHWKCAHPEDKIGHGHHGRHCGVCGELLDGPKSEAESIVAAVSNGEQFIKAPSFDPVERPAHYNQGKIEVIDFIEDQKLDFRAANVIKYTVRAPHKGKRLEDLKKARWYLDRLIKEVERGQ